jgi:hypothetical protein
VDRKRRKRSKVENWELKVKNLIIEGK